MHTNVPVLEENASEELPKIYSKKAIRLFGIFFSPVFAGVLLRQNLVDIGNTKAGNFVLMVSFGFFLFIAILMTIFDELPNMASLVPNMAGTAFLVSYFYEKYFPEAEYRYKSVWKPLAISLAIIIPLLMLAIMNLPY